MTDTPKPPKKRAPRKRTVKPKATAVQAAAVADDIVATRDPAVETPIVADDAAPAPTPAAHTVDDIAAAPVAVVDAPAPAAEPASALIVADAVSLRRGLIRTLLDVRWGDMDAFSHVNNSVFLTYLEEARLRWLQALPGPWIEEHAAPLLAAANVQFRRPIEWPGSVAVELHVERVGTSSLTISHRIVDANDAAKLFCDGHTVMVWIDHRTGKGSSLPAAVRAACE